MSRYWYLCLVYFTALVAALAAASGCSTYQEIRDAEQERMLLGRENAILINKFSGKAISEEELKNIIWKRGREVR